MYFRLHSVDSVLFLLYILSGGIDDKISQKFFSGRYSVKILIYARVEYTQINAR